MKNEGIHMYSTGVYVEYFYAALYRIPIKYSDMSWHSSELNLLIL